MSSHDSYNNKSTSISYPWPPHVSAVERVALSAQGDLQRVLSAYFARPISIAVVYSHTSTRDVRGVSRPLHLPNPAALASISPETPIIQTRQVHLQCAGKIVCTATSTVRITSPQCARLFLEEKFPIGQMFRRLGRPPNFELLSVGQGAVEDVLSKVEASHNIHRSQHLWRRYTLTIPDFECEILEEFPYRDMFKYGESWLADGYFPRSESSGDDSGTLLAQTFKPQQNLSLIPVIGFLIMLLFEIAMLFTGRFTHCVS